MNTDNVLWLQMARWKTILLLLLIQTPSVSATNDNFDSTSSRSSQFRQWESKQLLGYAFKRFDSTSLISCGQQCLRNQRCSSTNFKWSSSKKDGDGTCELNDHEFSFIEENVNFVHQEDVTFSMKVIQILVFVKVKANVDQYCLTF